MVGKPPESQLLLLLLSFWDSLRLFSLLCARPGTHSLINYMSVSVFHHMLLCDNGSKM